MLVCTTNTVFYLVTVKAHRDVASDFPIYEISSDNPWRRVGFDKMANTVLTLKRYSTPSCYSQCFNTGGEFVVESAVKRFFVFVFLTLQ